MADDRIVDAHVHVGLVGDQWPRFGRMSGWYREQLTFKIFLLYARLPADQVCDTVLRETVLKTIATCGLDHVVCLALDPVYDSRGFRQEASSHFWVDNDYILDLQRDSSKILFGASVHPYDPLFEERVKKYVDLGAVLLKWVPSGQQIDLAQDAVGKALRFLATAKGGKPLPLLLHVGPEYAVPTSDPRTTTNDFLGWSWWEKTANALRFGKRWNNPDIGGIHRNLRAGLEAGATIIFAHCGLPYFGAGFFAFFEHSDFKFIKGYLSDFPAGGTGGRCFADVSAFCTPVRAKYFGDVRTLPEGSLLLGSDFPTPIFELSTTSAERDADFKAVLKGHVERIIVPEDNLLDVNFRQLRLAFPGHPLFTNFWRLIGQ
jgi:hypothetical protein